MTFEETALIFVIFCIVSLAIALLPWYIIAAGLLGCVALYNL